MLNRFLELKNIHPILAFIFNILAIYLFWMLVFPIFRIAFIIANYDLLQADGVSIGELLPVFYHSIALDFSMASYFLLVISLILGIGLFIKSNVFYKIVNYFQYILIFLLTALSVGEIGLYPEWKIKINAKALEYLKRPSEVLESNKTWDTIWQTLLIIGLFAILMFLYKVVVKNNFQKLSLKSKWWMSIPTLLLSMGFIFVGMRGGFKPIPISQSESYFSKYDIVNDISVNTTWNLIYNLLKSEQINKTNVFISLDNDLANRIVDDIHRVKKDTTISILNTKKPNVLFLIMESWSADMVSVLGGKKGASNNFDRISKEGLLFTQCYSSGNRSQQGLASILGGFPALPITTLTAVPEKMRQTQTITPRFNDDGYFTAFYYGGSLRYGNIKAYLIHNKFQEIEEDGDMKFSIPRGKLGIHDGYMFNYLLEKLDDVKKPFFVNYFTMSSHSPYDQPMDKRIDWNDSEDDYHNSFYYSDSCLGDFIKVAKTKDWYNNTLIVIVADHSHQAYTHRAVSNQDYRHIPMLFVGGALKKEFRNKTFDKICSQTDIGTTVLKQIKLDADSFYWSKNLMNPYVPEFAYFETNQGYGFIRPQGFVAYNHFNKKYMGNTAENDSIKEVIRVEGAAYLQKLFEEFIGL